MSEHSEELRDKRRRMADALFEKMGDEYMPVAMVGLRLDGAMTDPNAFRTAIPEAARPFLPHGGAEALIAQFSYTVREFAKHPEDIGPIDPVSGKPKEE